MPKEVVEIGHVVAGLVTMCILAEKTGHVADPGAGIPLVISEQGVESGGHGLLAAHQSGKALKIMWNKETELPRNTFRKVT